MIHAIGSLLHVLLASLGVIVGTQPATASILTVSVTVAVLAAVLASIVLLGFSPSHAAHASLGRPRRSIDVSALIAQSDPDAAGHPRSRAPGFSASAA